jgi:hypothetical protein
VLHSEVELDASFHFAGSREAAGVAARRCGGEGGHGAGGVGVEAVVPLPSAVAHVEAQPAGQEETQGPGLASSADPLARQVSGQPGPRQQVRGRPLRTPRDFVADVAAVGLQQSSAACSANRNSARGALSTAWPKLPCCNRGQAVPVLNRLSTKPSR